MYRGEWSEGEGWAPGYSLQQYLEEGRSNREIEYSRYWHGYLLVLRPLLMLTNVATIRLLNAVFQFLLIMLFIWVCYCKNQMKTGMAMGYASLFLYPFTMFFSLSLSICYYIMILAAIILVYWHQKLSNRCWYFFLIIGVMTAYFDLLTYPLVTLGFPVCIMITISDERIKRKLQKFAISCIGWGVGYLGMWSGKWILTDMLLHTGTIKDAVQTIMSRTEKAPEHSILTGFTEVLQRNVSVYGNLVYICLISGLLFVVALAVVKHRNIRGDWMKIIPYIFIAALPFVWYLGTQNHSYEHWMFTCKILSISFFAVICAVIQLCKKERKE